MQSLHMASVDIVVTTYKEKLSWLLPYVTSRPGWHGHLYHTSGSVGPLCRATPINVNITCHVVPNRGFEWVGYLYHITRHYKELVTLHDDLYARGLRILAFPCNQFGKQEPGSAEDIRSFADGYGVQFDMFAKVDVNGPHAHPVFQFLKSKLSDVLGSSIKWNWTKFLVDRDGTPQRLDGRAQAERVCRRREAAPPKALRA